MTLVKVGTRKSQLALTQTQQVVDSLKKANPTVDFELVPYQTTGDKLVHVSLQNIGGKGVFVKDIEKELLMGTIDIAIHSLKDVPSILPEGCIIGAIPKREDVRDCLIFKNGQYTTLDSLPKGAIIGTSSLRRKTQLLAYRPDLVIQSLRGNIDTRIQKVQNGEYDAIVLAMAGLRRMGWLDKQRLFIEPLPINICLPAIAQGALAIECCSHDKHIQSIIQKIHDEETAKCVDLERAFLKQMNGDCTFPIGALATYQNHEYTLKTVLASDDMTKCLYANAKGRYSDELVQQVVLQLKTQGAFGIQ